MVPPNQLRHNRCGLQDTASTGKVVYSGQDLGLFFNSAHDLTEEKHPFGLKSGDEYKA